MNVRALVEAFRQSGKPAYLLDCLSELKEHLDEMVEEGDVVPC